VTLRDTWAGTLSSSAAREVLAEMADSGASPVRSRWWSVSASSRSATRTGSGPWSTGSWPPNPAKVEEYRAGRTGLLGFFVGQVMRETGGKANPELTKELIGQRLS
jgi:hypothetical protein